MKVLKDGTEVDADTYYFLLAWNDKDNKKFMSERFNKDRLNELTINEYRMLWLYATTTAFNNL